MHLAFLLLLLVSSSSQVSIKSIEQSGGPCSVNVAGVQGSVTINGPINCPGFSREAMKTINALLATNKSLRDQLTKAQTAQAQYLELEQRLANAGINNAEAQKAEGLIKDGKFAEAAALLKDVIKGKDKDLDEIAGYHYDLGIAYELQFKPSMALPEYEQAYRLRENNSSYSTAYAQILMVEGQFEQSKKVYGQILPNLRALAKSDPQHNQVALARALANLSLDYAATQELDQAKSVVDESLAIIRPLAKRKESDTEMYLVAALSAKAVVYEKIAEEADADDDDDSPDVKTSRHAIQEVLELLVKRAKDAPAYASLLRGQLQMLQDESEKAEQSFQVALKTARESEKQDPRGAHEMEVLTLDSLADLYSEDRTEDAVRTLKQEVELCRGLLVDAPQIKGWCAQAIQALADNQAGLLHPPVVFAKPEDAVTQARKAFNEWKQQLADPGSAPGQLRKDVENAYAESIKMFSDLAEEEPDRYRRSLVTAQLKMASFFRGVDLEAEAETAYDKTLKLEREFVKAQPADYEPVLADTLTNAADVYRRQNKVAQADQADNEALAMLRRLAASHPNTEGVKLVGLLREAARRQIESHQVAAAAPLYKEAWDVCKSLAETDNSTEYSTQLDMTIDEATTFYLKNQMEANYDSMMTEVRPVYWLWFNRNPWVEIFLAPRMMSLAANDLKAKRYRDAAESYQLASDIILKHSKLVNDRDDSSTSGGTVLLLAANAYNAEGNLTKAAEKYEAALTILRTCDSACREPLVDGLEKLAQIYRQTGRASDAAKIDEEASHLSAASSTQKK